MYKYNYLILFLPSPSTDHLAFTKCTFGNETVSLTNANCF